jgi:hypothetical protein
MARTSAQNSHQAFAAEDAALTHVDSGAVASIFIAALSLRSMALHDSHSDRECQKRASDITSALSDSVGSDSRSKLCTQEVLPDD